MSRGRRPCDGPPMIAAPLTHATDESWFALEVLWTTAAAIVAAVLLSPVVVLVAAMVVLAAMVPLLLGVRAVVDAIRRATDPCDSGFDDDVVAGGDGAGLEHPGIGP